MFSSFMSGVKGICHGYTWGVVLKQLNYPISMLPSLIRSVDRIVNDTKITPVVVVNFLLFTDSTNFC